MGDYEISIHSDFHVALDSKTVTVDRNIIYNDETNGVRERYQTAAKNLFTEAAGDGSTYLSRRST